MALARIKYLRLTAETAPAAIACVAETFSRGEEDPFTRLLSLKQHHWAQLAGSFIERAAHASTPLSVVAFNTTTGQIDGVMVNQDYLTPTPTVYRQGLSSDWKAVRGLFRELEGRFNRSHLPAPEPGDILQCLYFTCVRPSARGQGVMKGLWSNTIDIAREANFSSIAANASTEHVRGVLSEHLGFTEQAAVNYDEFEFEGAKVFAGLPKIDPTQYSRLSLSLRKVPSDLYV